MSSVLDDMQARAVVPAYPRTFAGLTAKCQRAAATSAHLLVLLGCAQCRRSQRRKSPCRLMVTPTRRPALHWLEGRSNTNGGHMTASKRIGSAPASTTAAPLERHESKHTAPPTGRGSTRNVEEVGESRWEGGDEWPQWHNHALMAS